jgi:hypothetical protein
MSVKVQKKADKLVQGAVGVFADAIAQVEKANVVLSEGIVADDKKLAGIDKAIDALRAKKAEVISQKNEKYNSLEKNEALISKLVEFAG